MVAGIIRVQRRPQRLDADPMPRPFVGDHAAPAAGASRFSRLVASVGNGTGPGNEYDTRAALEGTLQSDFHVSDDFDRAANDFDQQPLNQAGNTIVSRAGDACAGARDLLRRDAGLDACFVDCTSYGIASAGLAYSQDATTGTSTSAENRSVVAEKAAGFGAATVDAEEKSHRE